MLADYVIARFFPELTTIAEAPERYARLLREVVERTARLVAHWQAVGFAHGVLNTDNLLSILGLTLDYGPYGFLDAYDPGFSCQLQRRAGPLRLRSPAAHRALESAWRSRARWARSSRRKGARAALAAYDSAAARTTAISAMRAKLGLPDARDEDNALIVALLVTLAEARADYAPTSSVGWDAFVAMPRPRRSSDALFADPPEWRAWVRRYRARLAEDPRTDEERERAMQRVNPAYMLQRRTISRSARSRRRRTAKAASWTRSWRVLRAPVP